MDEDEGSVKKDSTKCEAKVENDGDSEQENLWAADSDRKSVV